MFEFLGLLLLAIVAPLWIIAHYVTRWRSATRLSEEDEKMLADVWNSVERMDKRIRNLERILDADDKEWRERT